jgi:ubiquinol-cytochrome c reductase cytochrome b subunit
LGRTCSFALSPDYRGRELSRSSLHVFVIPGLLIALTARILRLVLTKGINEYPQPGTVVRKDTYGQEYERC